MAQQHTSDVKLKWKGIVNENLNENTTVEYLYFTDKLGDFR